MARETVVLCDVHGDDPCRNMAQSYRVWHDGDRQAWSIDLCDEHAAPMLDLLKNAQRVDLPAKPRVRMEPTKLRTTEATRRLKRE